MRRWSVNPPMGQVIGGWFGAMVVLGIAGGWLFGPTQVTLHTIPPAPRSAPATDDEFTSTVAGTIGAGEVGLPRHADAQPAGQGRPARP